MYKVSMTLSLDKDVVDWLSTQGNRSEIVNSILRQLWKSRQQDNPAWLDKRMAEVKAEFEELRKKRADIAEKGG